MNSLPDTPGPSTPPQVNPERPGLNLLPCAKCGSPEFSIQYHSAGTHGKSTAEHMHLACQRCGYSWEAPPLDHFRVAPDVSGLEGTAQDPRGEIIRSLDPDAVLPAGPPLWNRLDRIRRVLDRWRSGELAQAIAFGQIFDIVNGTGEPE